MTERDTVRDKEQAVPGVGPCSVCGSSGKLNARICAKCEATLGRRTAELIAQARVDRDFACAAIAEMNPLAQRRFITMLGDPREGTEWAPRAVKFSVVAPALRKASADSAAPGPQIAKASPSVVNGTRRASN